MDSATWDRLRHEHLTWLSKARSGPGRLALDGVDLSRGRHHGLRLKASSWVRCDLTGATFASSDLRETEIADTRGPRIVLAMASAAGARWTRCDFAGASADLLDLSGAVLDLCVLAGGSLRRANFRDARLVACTLDDADLADALWPRATVESCSLRGARLVRLEGESGDELAAAPGAVFRDCDLRGADLGGLRLGDTRFERCRVSGIRGRPTLLGPVRFIGCDRSAAGDGPLVEDGDESWFG